MQRPSSHFRSLALSEHEPLFRLNVRFWQILLQKSQIARRQMASITLPRSPVSLSSGDEVPHIFYTKIAFSTYRRPERPGSGFGAARATTWG
jgi:hypothetical protein